MNSKSYDIIIAGFGIAGYAAAISARKQNKRVSILIISKDSHPTYSAPSLPDVISGHIKPETAMVVDEEALKTMKIDVMLNTCITAGDPKEKTVVTDSGHTLKYGKLIIATGSVPIQLRRMQGTSLPGNFILKTMDDATKLSTVNAKAAVVVGTGAIGLEGAAALKERGVEQVTIVEALDWINPKCFDRAASAVIEKALNALGIDVIVGEGVQSVLGDKVVEGVETAKRTIPCDMVLWGIGMRPEASLAPLFGVELGKRGGISVDGFMRTNVEDVYAAGDCTEPYDLFFKTSMPNMLWRTAQEQGDIAGMSVAGGSIDEPYDGGRLLFLTHVGSVPCCAYGYTQDALKGQRLRVLEKQVGDVYRKVILKKNLIQGFQLVGSLEGAELLYAQMAKGEPVDMAALNEAEPAGSPLRSLALAAFIKQLAR